MSVQKRNRSDVVDETAFAASLEELTPEDISENELPKANVDITWLIRKGLVMVCTVVFIYSGWLMAHQLTSKVRANNAYDDIRQMFYDDSGLTPDGALVAALQSPVVSPITGNVYEDGGSESVDEQFLIRSKLNTLKAINSDIYGWIKIDGTRVDYPVVQGEDNDYYLRYTFAKDYMYSGALFVDCNNSKSLLENYNTVIYGHNMTDGSMFHTLFNFRDKKFFENGLVEITTDDGLYIYEIFSAHVVNETDPYFITEFENEEAFINFANDMQAQSVYTKKFTFTPDDRILTLSTCTNIRDYERFAVHARLIYPKIKALTEE